MPILVSIRPAQMKDIASFADSHLRIFDRPRPASIEAIRSVHLIGICGTGMGSLAGLLKEAGYDVRGSDSAAYPPMSTRLGAMDIPVFGAYDVSNMIPEPDLTIVGNACTPTHVEATYARDHGLAQMSFPEAVAYFFFGNMKPIVVAGTHGKTTTTGLAIHIFSELKLDPGYLVGGVLSDRNSSYAVGSGEHFIIEGDEYDSAYFDKRPKFMHYQPHIAIVTSLEYDHVDIYEDFDDYLAAFHRFASSVDPSGFLILNADDDNVTELAESTEATVLTYGFSENANFMVSQVATDGETQTFLLSVDNDRATSVRLPMNGKHNIMNALAAIAASVASGQKLEEAADSLASFGGLKRRQEVVFDDGDITVLDDFAHHPTAVGETIQAIRQKYPESRIVAVFEPRSNSSRRKVFQQPYIDAFKFADVAIISSPPFRHNDNRDDFMDINALVEGIGIFGVDAVSFENFDALFEHLLGSIRQGDVVLIMSNGGFSGIHTRLKENLLST